MQRYVAHLERLEQRSDASVHGKSIYAVVTLCGTGRTIHQFTSKVFRSSSIVQTFEFGAHEAEWDVFVEVLEMKISRSDLMICKGSSRVNPASVPTSRIPLYATPSTADAMCDIVIDWKPNISNGEPTNATETSVTPRRTMNVLSKTDADELHALKHTVERLGPLLAVAEQAVEVSGEAVRHAHLVALYALLLLFACHFLFYVAPVVAAAFAWRCARKCSINTNENHRRAQLLAYKLEHTGALVARIPSSGVTAFFGAWATISLLWPSALYYLLLLAVIGACVLKFSTEKGLVEVPAEMPRPAFAPSPRRSPDEEASVPADDWVLVLNSVCRKVGDTHGGGGLLLEVRNGDAVTKYPARGSVGDTFTFGRALTLRSELGRIEVVLWSEFGSAPLGTCSLALREKPDALATLSVTGDITATLHYSLVALNNGGGGAEASAAVTAELPAHSAKKLSVTIEVLFVCVGGTLLANNSNPHYLLFDGAGAKGKTPMSRLAAARHEWEGSLFEFECKEGEQLFVELMNAVGRERVATGMVRVLRSSTSFSVELLDEAQANVLRVDLGVTAKYL